MMRLSVYLGCGAVLSFKEMDEVVCVIEACFRRDFMDFFFCGKKQVLCGFKPLFVQISDGRQTESGRKLAADPILAHMTVFFQILQLQRAFQMIVYIVPQLPQIGGVFFCVFFRCLRRTGFRKQFCHNGGYETGIPQLVCQLAAGFAGQKLFQVPWYGRMPSDLYEQ